MARDGMIGRMLPRVLLLLILCIAAPGAFARAAPRYWMHYDAGTRTMRIALCLPHAAAEVRFEGGDRITTVRRDNGATVTRDGDGWRAQDWRTGECLRYDAELGRLADRLPRGHVGGDDLVTDPQDWLLRVGDGGDAEVRVELPSEYAISVPWRRLRASGAAQRFEVPATPLDWIARVAIGRFDEQAIALSGGILRVAILDAQTPRARLRAWLRRVGAAAVAAYGRLPLAEVQVLVVPVAAARDAVVFGQSTRGQGNALTLFVDASASAVALERDWIAVHELAHLFHPYLGDRGAWLAEGLASYYQNVLRARVGMLTASQAWSELDAGFARGDRETPADSALALEQASERMGERRDFLRVYWSGAAYWLSVDAELRAGGNRRSVDEALRRFAVCCLPSARRWTPEEFVARLDALLGVDVFARRYDEFRARRDFPDLAPLYRELGLRRDGAALRFDDDAPQARLRDAIMRAR